MKKKDKDNPNEIYNLWESLNISKVVFEFSCGGDNMEETSISIIDKKDTVIDSNVISDFFYESVYDFVEFYENSDGYYIGEYGDVIITLCDDLYSKETGVLKTDIEIFEYHKESTARYTESKELNVEVTLTEEEYEYLSSTVGTFEGSESSIMVFNYKKDFIYTDIIEQIEKSIETKITDACGNEMDLQNVEIIDQYVFTLDSLDTKNRVMVSCIFYFETLVYL